MLLVINIFSLYLQNDVDRKPAGEISLDHGCLVSRSDGAHTFEVNTGKKIYYLTADSTTLVEEWVRTLQNVLRRNATRLLLSREDNTPTIKGWLTKVKNGHAKHCWCLLIGKTFVYFKNPNESVSLFTSFLTLFRKNFFSANTGTFPKIWGHTA